jgi:hypothetical protein
LNVLKSSLVLVGFLGALVAITPAMASMASFEVSATLPDQSAQSMEKALHDAIEIAVRSAFAMGLYWIRITPPVMTQKNLTIGIIATDVDPETGKEVQSQSRGLSPAAQGLPPWKSLEGKVVFEDVPSAH